MDNVVRLNETKGNSFFPEKLKEGYFVEYQRECIGHKFSNGEPLIENCSGWVDDDYITRLKLCLMDDISYKQTVFVDISYDFKVVPDSLKYEPMTDEIRQNNNLIRVSEIGDVYSDFNWS